MPYQFNPSLGLWGGLVAVMAAFARILTLCSVVAVWSVLSLSAWQRMAGQIWRYLALLPMLVALPAALIPTMLAIAAIERWMSGRR